MEVSYICNENELMEKVKNGDKQAYEKIVLKYRKNAIGFAYRFVKDSYLAEDIVQESFASIYIKRSNYKTKDSFKAFLYTIIRNRCIDYLRKAKNMQVIYLDEMERSFAEVSLDEHLVKKDELKCAKRIIESLSYEYRTVFWLYEYEGFAYKEIAGIMNKSLPQVKIMLYRARNKIKKYIKEDIQYEK